MLFTPSIVPARHARCISKLRPPPRRPDIFSYYAAIPASKMPPTPIDDATYYIPIARSSATWREKAAPTTASREIFRQPARMGYSRLPGRQSHQRTNGQRRAIGMLGHIFTPGYRPVMSPFLRSRTPARRRRIPARRVFNISKPQHTRCTCTTPRVCAARFDAAH